MPGIVVCVMSMIMYDDVSERHVREAMAGVDGNDFERTRRIWRRRRKGGQDDWRSME